MAILGGFFKLPINKKPDLIERQNFVKIFFDRAKDSFLKNYRFLYVVKSQRNTKCLKL